MIACPRLWVPIAALAGLSLASSQEPAQEQRSRPPTRAPGGVDAAALTALVGELDRAFSSGDADAYLARFEPDNRALHERFAERVRRLLQGKPGWKRCSDLLSAPRSVGQRAVAPMRSELKLPGDAPAIVETGFLVLRRDGARLVPCAFVAAPIEADDCFGLDAFVCPACNYEIGGVDGWLGVPLPGAAGESIDGVSFHLLGTDVTCDLAVEVEDPLPGQDPQDVDAQAALERIAAALSALAAASSGAMPESWRPSTLRTAVPEGFSGARQRLVLPDASTAILHVTALGPLRHVLLIRGSVRGVDAAPRAIDELLASYRLLDLALDRATMAKAPFAAHTGGRIDGATFRSERHQVRCDGPAGWSIRQRSCGAAFKVTWTSLDRSGWLCLSGHRPPTGLSVWRECDADCWFADLCARAQLTVEPGSDHGWHAAPCGGHERKLRLVAAPGHGKPTPRWLHLWLRDDLLIAADAHGCAADEPLLRAAMASIRRP